MNPLVKTILMRRSSDQGFIIPTVIALGLIMLLLGTVNVFKSNDENITAIAQRDTREALTAAEVGVAYYQDLMDKNKVIATYSACNTGLTWNNFLNLWICLDPVSDQSWARAGNIPGINDSCDFDGGNSNSTDVTWSTTVAGWQNVPGSSGQYRIVDYTYSDADDRGTLIVEGRDGSSDESAITRVQVEFPIQPGLEVGDTGDEITDDLNNLNPALWISSDNNGTITSIVHGNSTDNSNHNLIVNGNILVSNANCQLTDTTTKNIANYLGNVAAVSLALPATPSPPDDATVGSPFDLTKINVITDDNEIKNTNLPRSGDNSEIVNGQNVYHYLIEDNLNLSGEDIVITSGAKVILYVQGSMTFGSNVDVNQNPANGSDNLEIYGNSSSAQFGCAIAGGCLNNDIDFTSGGTTNIKAFIHAPNATVTSQNGKVVNLTGAMWVKQWNDTSHASNQITITPDDSFFNYSSIRNLDGTSNFALKPIIYPPSNWTTQRVP